MSAQAWFISQLARDVAEVEPDLAYLAPGYVILWFAVAVCTQVALGAVPKNGRAKAVRFTTLHAICRVLDCQPRDVLRYEA